MVVKRAPPVDGAIRERLGKLLSGYRIIESSMLLNGAATGMMLVDLGADVIKIESPFLGDYLRLPD